ncbi:hypothetical protein P153DRAFT_201254 [Dothidotthia symphoricarpi CBS 119687]|uniref:Uncharacterized protein n=1 Tax=Dothidotthia symphoricarpi CBS 119687 TaxID=1392245 RepID=A0A6A6ALE0_9PLEO|nr:uncharacterized protein P153DRAFT_201254 [Dothidotthia symphoricarpi CBS 119687]KAF2131697.1 hypothetical protein P153DRAFT_201254 [Dothidotthia symphoricarpi CBS 119687]
MQNPHTHFLLIIPKLAPWLQKVAVNLEQHCIQDHNLARPAGPLLFCSPSKQVPNTHRHLSPLNFPYPAQDHPIAKRVVNILYQQFEIGLDFALFEDLHPLGQKASHLFEEESLQTRLLAMPVHENILHIEVVVIEIIKTSSSVSEKTFERRTRSFTPKLITDAAATRS